PADVRGVSGCGRRPFPRWVVVRLIVDVHTPKANVQYTTLDRKPLKSVRNRHQTNTILNTSHEPKSTTVLELKYRSYEMFTIIQEFTEKYRDCSIATGADSKIARQERGESTSDPLNASELAPNSANGLMPSLIAWAKSQ